MPAPPRILGCLAGRRRLRSLARALNCSSIRQTLKRKPMPRSHSAASRSALPSARSRSPHSRFAPCAPLKTLWSSPLRCRRSGLRRHPDRGHCGRLFLGRAGRFQHTAGVVNAVSGYCRRQQGDSRLHHGFHRDHRPRRIRRDQVRSEEDQLRQDPADLLFRSRTIRPS